MGRSARWGTGLATERDAAGRVPSRGEGPIWSCGAKVMEYKWDWRGSNLLGVDTE
jgi:hypothetical protein